MSESYPQHTSPNVDLSEYEKKIAASEDRPLFDEAVAAANAGALRAAYVMIWLACAESLKRRFREAKPRDNSAGKVVGEIVKLESQQKSVDKFLLDKAREYGFLSDTGHTMLEQVYEMRCIYGHPYEAAPSREKVLDAAATVVDQVLSQPVKLREGYGRQVVNSLLAEGNILDDQKSVVRNFAKDIIRRVDEQVHGWLLNEYLKELEKLSDDPEKVIFVRRGVWFCRAMLSQVGVAVFTQEEWHSCSRRFPKTLMRVCSTANLFRSIGDLAKDSLVGFVLDESKTRASTLRYLERLNDVGALSQRQQERFFERVSDMTTSEIRASGLSTKTCYTKLIASMKILEWNTQNPAISVVFSNGPQQASQLTEEQQVVLGRNILQAAEGRARSADGFLHRLHDEPNWPINIIRGIASESFSNENNDIRPKDRHLGLVLSVLDHCEDSQRDQIIAEIVGSINAGTPREWLWRGDFDRMLETLKVYAWSEQLVRSLEAKLPHEEEQEF